MNAVLLVQMIAGDRTLENSVFTGFSVAILPRRPCDCVCWALWLC